MKVLIAILVVLVVGCGQLPQDTTTEADLKESEDKQPIDFQGYLLSAFDIQVDGQNYSDSEDFYTQKINELVKQQTDGGYSDYNMNFDASIGLDDLKQGMRVYIVPSGSRGYTSETVIDYDGTFKVQFPPEAQGDSMRVRANKRINVILTNNNDAEDVVNWCYNFYAKESDAKVDIDSKPVILDQFFTKLTKYKCEVSVVSGIQIPVKVSASKVAVPVFNSCTDGPGIPVSEAIAASDVEYYKECIVTPN